MNAEEKVAALGHTFSTRGWVDVIRPALLVAINNATDSLITGKRPDGDSTTDEGLKNRVIALRWVLGWEKSREMLVQQLEVAETVRLATTEATSGGSPYE